MQELFGCLLVGRLDLDEIRQHARGLEAVGLSTLDGSEQPLDGLGGVGAVRENLVERIQARLQARKSGAGLIEIAPRRTQFRLARAQFPFRAPALRGERFELHLARRQPGGELRFGGSEPLQILGCALLFLLRLRRVAFEGGQIRVGLGQLVLESRAFAQQAQDAGARGLHAPLARRHRILQLIAVVRLGLEPLARLRGLLFEVRQRCPVRGQLLAHHGEAALGLLRLALSLRQPLLDGRDLLRLILQPPACALQIQVELCKPLASFRQFGLGLVAFLLRAAVILLLPGGPGGEFFKAGRGHAEVERDLGRLALQHEIAAGEHLAQPRVHILLEFFVAPRLGRLALEGIGLAPDLFEDVEDPLQVVFGAFQPCLCEPAPRLEPGDARGFLDHRAAVLRARAEQLPDAPLLNDGVGLRAEPGAHEDVLDVAQPRHAAVDQVLAFAGAEQAPRHRDLAPAVPVSVGFAVHSRAVGPVYAIRPVGPVRVAVGMSVRALRRLDPGQVEAGIDQRHGDGGEPHRLAFAGSGEDDILHPGAAQGLGRLLAQHPVDRIRQVGLAAAIRTDDARDSGPAEPQLGPVGEGLEPL